MSVSFFSDLVGLQRPESKKDRFERLLVKLANREYDYEPREPQKIDWSSYTEGQIHELNDTLELIRDAVDTAGQCMPVTPKSKRRGRPREYDPTDLVKIILLQSYFECSNRVAAGYALVFREKLDLIRDPNYKAIERAYGDPAVGSLLRHVFALTQEPEKGRVDGFTLDGSGLPRSVKTNWERDKGTSNAKPDKLDGAVIMLTIPHLITTAWVSHPVGFASESPTLKPLVAQTVEHYGQLTGIVSADAAFLGRENCEVIRQAGGVPRIFPKRGIRLENRGLSAWFRMTNELLDDPQQWLRDYHHRSLSETQWSRHKRRHPKPLRKRIVARREGEKATRFTVDNLTRLAMLRRLGLVNLGALRRPAA